MSELNLTSKQREYLKSLVRLISETADPFSKQITEEIRILRLVNESGKLTNSIREKIEGTQYNSFEQLINSWKQWYLWNNSR